MFQASYHHSISYCQSKDNMTKSQCGDVEFLTDRSVTRMAGSVRVEGAEPKPSNSKRTDSNTTLNVALKRKKLVNDWSRFLTRG